MKHLKTIQTIAKAGKILATIVFVCSIIGVCGCLIGLTVLGLGNSEFAELISEGTQLGLTSSIFGLVSGLIWCVAEIITSYVAMNYFKRELEVGTPFTYDGAKELFRVGLFGIIVPLAANVVEAIAFGCFALIDSQIIESDISSSFDIGLGIAFLVISVLCKHGAELAERLQQPTQTTAEEPKEQFEESQN